MSLFIAETGVDPMDKNKSRTDMLAAGRKKLQQFRQKKDGKGSGSGSQGKSSKKSDSKKQNERDADSDAVSKSSSRSSENVAADTDVAVDNLSTIPSTQSTVERNVVDSESSVPRVEVDEHDVDPGVRDAETNAQTIGTESERTVVGSGTSNSESGRECDNVSVPIDPSSDPSVIDSAGVEISITSQSISSEENVLPLQDDNPDTSLMLARRDQEVEGLDGGQSRHNSEVELEGHIKISSSEPDISVKAFSGASLPCDTEPLEKMNEVSVSGSEELWGTALASGATEISSVVPAVENQEGGHVLPSFNEGSLKEMLESSENPSETGLSISNSSSEFSAVLKSREPVSSAELVNSNLMEPDYLSRDLFERLKEELFLANFGKDIYQVQLAQQSELQNEFDHERRKLVDEIASLSALLREYGEKNQSLTEELSECRSGLNVAVSVREELETQFCSSQANVEGLSAKANELEVSLGISQGELLSLTAELANCKQLVASLQVETENLNGTIASLEDEKNKILQEKDFHFEKLSKEFSALQSETSDLTTSLSSLASERKLLEEEKETLCLERENLLLEYSDCKRLLSALQLENGSLNESLDLVTEEWLKLDVGNTLFANENERLFSQVVAFQQKLSTEQGEREQIEADLKLVSLRLEQVIEENMFLSSSLEVHKARLVEADSSRHETPRQSREIVNDSEISEVKSGDYESAFVGEDSHSDTRKQADIVSPTLVDNPLFDLRTRQILHEWEVFDDYAGFVSLKKHLEETEKTLHQLEKANEGVQTHSASFIRQGGQVPAPGVSKLIQAFESKVHTDEHNAEESPLAEEKSTMTDPFVLMQEETRNLKALFKKLVVDAFDACELFKRERDGRRTVQDQYEISKDHEDILDMELSVLYEVFRQHVSNAEAANYELVALCEATKQDVTSLRAENTRLSLKLHSCASRIGQLHSQLYGIQQTYNEMTAVVGNQMEDLQKEVCERISLLEQESNRNLGHVVELVQKLGEHAGNVGSAISISEEYDRSDAVGRVAASVTATTEVIEDLKKKLEDAQTCHEVVSTTLKEVNQSFDDLHQKKGLAVGTLQKIHSHLTKLVHLQGLADETEKNIEGEKLLEPLDYSDYGTLMSQLEHLLSERQESEFVIERLNMELTDQRTKFEGLERGCLSADAVCKLVESVEGALDQEDIEVDLDELPASRFESLVSTVVRKYNEARLQLSLSKEERGSKGMELSEEIQQLTAVCLEHEAANVVLKESLSRAEEALAASSSELEKKASELEQSEQRVSSIREKLGIAVSKGKGLLVKRDSLQQRIEALESELSYIRNSATGLRESFLLKDSVLQRIEEIFEDLDLPEHFHSRDILEKVGWLARSVGSSVLPSADSESGTVEPWKEDVHSSEDMKRKYEDLQSKFYGLAEQNEMLEQSLLERNNLVQKWEELLDRIDMPSHLRSLEPEERIHWLGKAVSEAHYEILSLQEKVLNFENYCQSLNADLGDSQRRISDLESNLDAVTQEREYLSERMENLSQDYDKILAKVAEYEDENRTLQSELISLKESHHGKLSEKEADNTRLHGKLSEKETENTRLHGKLLEKEAENTRLQNEAANLQESVAAMLGCKERILSIEGDIRRLGNLITDALPDLGLQEQVSSESSFEGLEVIVRKLLENYVNFSLAKPVLGDVVDRLESDVTVTEEVKSRSIPEAEDSDTAMLRNDLEEAVSKLIHMTEEKDGYEAKQCSMAAKIEALDKRREELELLLNQEKRKSDSVREKLQIAVRKGKSVVQDRESLKLIIETKNAELEKLKSEIIDRENQLSEYETKFKALEPENLLLRNQLKENEQRLQDSGHTLSKILNNIANIHVGDGVHSTDPVEKLEQLVKLCSDLQSDLVSSEEESRRSKRAAELLLAELNEVQERNDNLLEELENTAAELSELTKERDVAEAAKLEAHSRLKELHNAHSLEQRDQFSELKGLKSSIDQLRKNFRDVSNLFADISSKDMEFRRNLENSIALCLNPTGSGDVARLPSFDAFLKSSSSSDNKGLFASIDSWLDSNVHGNTGGNSVTEAVSSVGHHVEKFSTEVGTFREKLYEHMSSMQEQASSLSESMAVAQRELISRNEFYEGMKREIEDTESAGKRKDKELVTLQKNIALLFEALSVSIMEIENKKAELLGNNSALLQDGTVSFSGPGKISSEESIKTMSDKLLFAVRDFACIKAEILEGSQKQMKNDIADLQKQVQEKEIQKERVCMDLVSQIKTAEAAAARYLVDLQSSRSRVGDLEKQLQVAEHEKQDALSASVELQQRVGSLTDVISAKDQEIEALMQALDEEESQMEDHRRKIVELEKVLQQKSLALEGVEAARGKVTKKLSITVNKFDELHELSASLLAEVEKLQSQLQERDSEVSFLRQEVTRCTNDALVASQRDLDSIHELSAWFDSMTNTIGVKFDVTNGDHQAQEHRELLKKKIESMLSEFVEIREAVQSKDELLQVERSKVGALTSKEEALLRSLREKESRLNLLESVGTSEAATGMTSEIMEVEPVINKWTMPGPSVTSQVRSLRKGNNEQVAIAIDMEPGSSSRLEDEDDDKVHGFKSLTTSRIIPRFTRPVTDMVDGLWVSCDRALMRQPALRLCIIIYWAVLHALLASVAV